MNYGLNSKSIVRFATHHTVRPILIKVHLENFLELQAR